jgi:hypothetical protein
MKVYIGTEYLTHKRYLIRVQAEGRVVEIIPATRGNVARLAIKPARARRKRPKGWKPGKSLKRGTGAREGGRIQ